jgi:hypothetical protein
MEIKSSALAAVTDDVICGYWGQTTIIDEAERLLRVQAVSKRTKYVEN